MNLSVSATAPMLFPLKEVSAKNETSRHKTEGDKNIFFNIQRDFSGLSENAARIKIVCESSTCKQSLAYFQREHKTKQNC